MLVSLKNVVCDELWCCVFENEFLRWYRFLLLLSCMQVNLLCKLHIKNIIGPESWTMVRLLFFPFSYFLLALPLLLKQTSVFRKTEFFSYLQGFENAGSNYM